MINYQEYPHFWQKNGRQLLEDYAMGVTNYVHDLLPEFAVKLSGIEVAEVLIQRFGESFSEALNPERSLPCAGWDPPKNGDWLKRTCTVGINVRTIKNFYHVVKYALTLPPTVNCIHLLPIWEPGVVASLYGMASWNINPEFFSREMYLQFPQLNTVEKQLKAVVNLLHLMGKKVGMDVIPHTDRYSEIVLANPGYFEWLQRDDLTITNHSSQLFKRVEEAIFAWLRLNDPADSTVLLQTPEHFFRELSETDRLLQLFGKPAEVDQRRERRVLLVDHLYKLGFEPVPATMAPPYRGLEVDPNPEAVTVDDAGRSWRDYRVTRPQEMSRVFGPLTRYKLFERQDDNQDWFIDFASPCPQVWKYVTEKYAEVVQTYGFDFMRGDMSHVQMRPAGTPAEPDAYYDLLGAVKVRCQQDRPYFAYFAESFLTAPGYMAYGDEIDHLEASMAEVTLGNLQSMVPGEVEFLSHLRHYLDIASLRQVTPAFTLITGDKDDPRFDKFYLHGNAARLFTGLFLAEMPTYYSLGYAQRDIHPFPQPNEVYTKLYVFHLNDGPKATHGPYLWGKNTQQFFQFQRIFQTAEKLLPKLSDHSTWTLPPDPTGGRSHFAWLRSTQSSKYLFIVNFGQESINNAHLPFPINGEADLQIIFSTHGLETRMKRTTHQRPNSLFMDFIGAGEGLILEIV